jgi:Na+/proline symporter
VFLTGILWKGATARAAFTTLVFGGLVGAARFLLDILHNALKIDLGLLNTVVGSSFLNFSVVVFAICVLLMIGISKLDTMPDLAKIRGLTVAWDGSRRPGYLYDAAVTLAVGGTIIGLWYHFR